MRGNERSNRNIAFYPNLTIQTEKRKPELLPCPFCGSTDIRYSLKITGHFDVRYHASMYCNKCHCYGARTLTEKVYHSDYKGRHQIEQDETIKQKAVDLWNTRTPKERGGEK